MILLSYIMDPNEMMHRGVNSSLLAHTMPPVSRTANTDCLARATMVAGSSLSMLRMIWI